MGGDYARVAWISLTHSLNHHSRVAWFQGFGHAGRVIESSRTSFD
jgi:hypothetical protein